MRVAYAHEAMLVMDSDGDLRAPGAAITAELCGHWEHEPPCPLAAHHTNAYRVGEQVRLRTLFASEPGNEAVVRERIDQALARGVLEGPDAVVTHWRLESSGATPVSGDEADHADRLANG
jgi:hypothetical protein